MRPVCLTSGHLSPVDSTFGNREQIRAIEITAQWAISHASMPRVFFFLTVYTSMSLTGHKTLEDDKDPWSRVGHFLRTCIVKRETPFEKTKKEDR